MKYTVILFNFILSFGLLSAQVDDASFCLLKDESGRSRDHNVDFTHMILEVAFAPEDGLVIGNVKYNFRPIRKVVDTLFFDGVDMSIKSARHNGQPVKFSTTTEGVTIYFEEALTWATDHQIEMDYEATPRKGLYFIGWNDPAKISRKQIWSQGQGIDNRHWIPSYDFQNDKLITETIIHFSRQYEVISNGELMAVEDRHNGDLTWHYKISKPHASYLVMLAIGQYDYKEMAGSNGVKIRQYFYPDRPNTFEQTYRYSVEMMDWCEKEFGVPYPWKTYANVPVQDFMYGAMENTTATIFTDYYIQDERAALERDYVGTNAHELVHQWFGDYITAWSSHDHWLHESFATHYAKHFRRFVDGEDSYQWIRWKEMQSAQRANKKNQKPVVHSKAGSSRHYPKGSLVIDMLRYVVGKDQYDAALTHYLKKHAYKNVDTHDFQMAFMEQLGMNLDWFFDQWLYRGGEPHFEITNSIEDDQTAFYITQSHDVGDLVGYFEMPVVFDVYYEGGSKSSVKQWVYGPKDTVVIPNPGQKNVSFVLFDPNNKILKTTEYKNKDAAHWMAQTLQAENMIDRYEALLALQEVDQKEKRSTLLKMYDNEKFYASRVEIVKQLANDKNSGSKKLIERAIYDTHPYVRRAVIENVDEIAKKQIEDFEQLLSDRSYVNIEKALRKLSAQFPEERKRYLEMTSNEIGHDHNIRIAWLELAFEEKPAEYRSELVAYSSESYGFRTRVNAMKALQNVNYCDDMVVGHIVNGMLCSNRRLVGPSKKALEFFKSVEEHDPIINDFYMTREWEDWEREIVEPIFQPDQEITN